MKLLLDTHIWLWLLENPSRLPAPVLVQLESAERLLLSSASVWEMAIKEQLGKLKTRGGVRALCAEIHNELQGTDLPITSEHALIAADLPAHHKDPFDRVLIAQAQANDVALVTADEQVRAYGGSVIWVAR